MGLVSLTVFGGFSGLSLGRGKETQFSEHLLSTPQMRAGPGGDGNPTAAHLLSSGQIRPARLPGIPWQEGLSELIPEFHGEKRRIGIWICYAMLVVRL